MVKVSIQGCRGSFHDIVARQKFASGTEITECSQFFQIFENVSHGRSDYGVVAIENSIGGSILENFDHLLKYDLRIIGEVYLRVMHNLIVLPGVKLDDIREVYTHPMAFAQCFQFLQGYRDWKRIPYDDTAGSVRLLGEKQLRNAAAIGSVLAAEIYGMQVLKRGIETDKNNYTRFLIISRQAEFSDSANKTSLVMQTEHRPGTLFECLKCFANEGLNLSKIESRPIVGRTWNYYFYLDLEAAEDAPETRRALECLKKSTSMVKILGSYERGEIINSRDPA